jgi:phosphoglycerate dehydrogenase-like enzyme
MEYPTGRKPRRVISDFPFAPADVERLTSTLGAETLIQVAHNRDLPSALTAHPEADVLCTFWPPIETRALAPHLVWLAMPSAGADGALRAGLVRAGEPPVVTNASGIHAVPISEFVFSLLLMWNRHWPTMLQAQRERHWADRAEWQRLRGRELHGTTLGVVGMGAIGRQVARLGRAFGMRVLATRRSAPANGHDPDADALYPITELHQLLAQADYVVLAVPHTSDTHEMIGDAELRAMKPTTFLVNIARGTIIDEPTLIRALTDGTIAGAGLDVFAEEPLPPSSPLWTLPNVIISPHLSGSSDQYSRRFTDLFLENIARYRSGEPLRNTVDPARGY